MSEQLVALITGAGSGIGRATAIAFLNAGHKVVLAGRRLDALKETISLASGTEALAVSTDVVDPDSVDALMSAIKDKWGRLDFVFNNAGVNCNAGPIGDISVDDFNHVIDVNLNGAFYIARAAFNVMREQSPQGGRIVNNGSISAHVPRWGSTPYTVSKHAISGLTRCVSLDGRPFNIACGQIDIGNAASDMTKKMSGGVPQADGSLMSEPTMDVNNVAKTVLDMSALSLDANIQTITIMATNMPLIGRG